MSDPFLYIAFCALAFWFYWTASHAPIGYQDSDGFHFGGGE